MMETKMTWPETVVTVLWVGLVLWLVATPGTEKLYWLAVPALLPVMWVYKMMDKKRKSGLQPPR